MISEFEKEKVFWTRKMSLRLVKYIHSRPNIWNPKHPKYTSVEYRDRTYAEFAAKYGNEFTGQAVKDRWTNIRSTFSNYLRKIKASQANGNGKEYKVNWHLWEECQFLKKVNRAVKDSSENVDAAEEEALLEYKEKVWDSEQNHCLYDNSTNPISCRSVAENLVTIFKGFQNDSFGLENSKYSKVGKAVTKKLSQMSSLEAAKVSKKIMEILCYYEENNPVNPNNIKTESI